MSLLNVENLCIAFPGRPRPSLPVRGLNLTLERGSVLGLVGQSGSGKSLSALAVMGMVPRPGRKRRQPDD
ncbi:MAG: ATP-binding cassette domain-containing protein [Desulfarculaceae bacterium]|nr:ATP-binding cassette domain-containing protein [Desulfarculaceae bacterium]MCF8071528.1 ATP-binding cassette domain-containing protein [Desulfarculaceae bacterium]MCF8102343.1 ATP-binding cassette domain-containing protein [Desulfarculaceae bacterium]MCF8114807.1 ATP-binding cassette domain-containing protein [Desulfarculaceae bacterium]